MIERRLRGLTVSWEPADCAHHYVLHVRQVEPGHQETLTPSLTDDEDYDDHYDADYGSAMGKTDIIGR